MFSSTKAKLLVGLYIFLILSIPLGAYLASQTQIFKSKASEPGRTNLTTKPPSLSGPAATEPTPSPTPSSPEIAASFGPTLSLKAVLEGRAANNQATKLFIGILEGTLTSNPKFLLNFTIDLPASGEYSNLSLAGLNPGAQYTALLKGSAQIATASAFIMSPTVSSLNGGKAINLLAGDLNEDNVINSSDLTIVQKAYGAKNNSANWNENADFNKDGIINSFDLALVSKNLNKTGASGAWISPVSNIASPSASLIQSPPIGSPDNSSGGYWIWIPKY